MKKKRRNDLSVLYDLSVVDYLIRHSLKLLGSERARRRGDLCLGLMDTTESYKPYYH